MSIRDRFISGFLALVMVAMLIPPVTVRAASIPTVVTETADVAYRSAVLHGHITANGGYDIIEYGFAYGIGAGVTQYEAIEGSIAKNTDVPFTLELEPGYDVWYQFYAKNELGTHRGEIKYISGPTFTVQSMDTTENCTANTIYMEGDLILDSGSADPDLEIDELTRVMVGFEYGTDKTNTAMTSFRAYTREPFSHSLAELEPETDYYFRAAAYEYRLNQAPEYLYGDWIKITTQSDVMLPVVVTEEPSEISTKSIVMNGSLEETNGVSTEYGFVYSLDQNLWRGPEIVGKTTRVRSFEAQLTDFQIGNTIYYCAYAKNEYGEVFGDIVSVEIAEDTEPPKITDFTVFPGSEFYANKKVNIWAEIEDNNFLLSGSVLIDGRSVWDWVGKGDYHCIDYDTYLTAGTHTIEVTALDAAGYEVSESTTVTVLKADPAVKSLSVSPDQGTLITAFTFTAEAMYTDTVVFYVDEYKIGEVTDPENGVFILEYDHFTSGGDRTIYAYACDVNGDEVRTEGFFASAPISIQVEGYLSPVRLLTESNQSIEINTAFEISWENGGEVPDDVSYNIYVWYAGKQIDKILTSDTGSVQIPASYFQKEGKYLISVYATAGTWEASTSASLSIHVVADVPYAEDFSLTADAVSKGASVSLSGMVYSGGGELQEIRIHAVNSDNGTGGLCITKGCSGESFNLSADQRSCVSRARR